MSTVSTPTMLYGRDDPFALDVAHLVSMGMGQLEATRLVLTPLPEAPQAPEWDAPRDEWAGWVHRWVHAVFAPLRRAVGLP